MDDIQKEEWIASVYQALEKCGEEGVQALAYMRRKKTRLGFNKQKASAAMWYWLDRNIYLNKEKYSVENTKPDDAYMLSLIVHEVCHLKQGFFKALSVYGELEAWQVGFRVLKQLQNGKIAKIQQKILDLPLSYDRVVLRNAATLMKEHSPGYRIDLLPTYPIGKEIVFGLMGKVPKIS